VIPCLAANAVEHQERTAGTEQRRQPPRSTVLVRGLDIRGWRLYRRAGLECRARLGHGGQHGKAERHRTWHRDEDETVQAAHGSVASSLGRRPRDLTTQP
jgi:hypothetical protein